MRLGENCDSGKLLLHRARQRVEATDIFDLLVKKLDTDSEFIRVRRENIDDVAAHTIGSTLEVQIIAGVLQLRELPKNPTLIDYLASREVHDHLEIGLRIAQTVN